MKRFGASWRGEIEYLFKDLQIPSKNIAALLTALPDSMDAWDYLSTFGEEVVETYWKTRHAFGLTGSVEELQRGVALYCRFCRPLSGAQAAYRRLKELPTSTIAGILDDAVEEINNSASAGGMAAHYIDKLFEELNDRPDITTEERARLEFRYLPFLAHRDKSLNLHRLMTDNPETFISVIAAIFKKENEDDASEVSPEEAKLAKAAYQLLSSLHQLPGQNKGDVDKEKLFDWISNVRRLAVEFDVVRVTDSSIGTLLAHCPASSLDMAWPHESMRSLLEHLDSDVVERAVEMKCFNMKGVYSKKMGEGGQQERALADKYRIWASSMKDYPRTASMLEEIAKGWLSSAENADIQARKEELRR